MYSLEHVVLHGAGQLAARHAMLLPHHHVHSQQNGCRGIDGHGRRHSIQGDVAEQLRQVFHGVDGHADAPNFALSHGMIGVVAHLSRKVERRGEPHLAGVEQLAKPTVGVLRGPEAGVLAHGPEPAGVHARVRAPGKGELAGMAQIPDRITGPVLRAVNRLHRAG